MKKEYIDKANNKLRDGALEVLNQFPDKSKSTSNGEAQLLGYAIDMKFWYYLIGPWATALFLKAYLIFELKDFILLIRVKKKNNFKFLYVSHTLIDKYSCTVMQSKGPFTHKLKILTDNSSRFALKFSKSIRWNKPNYTAEILSKNS